jgi:methionine synthase II (cobalamin-independent)
MFLAFLEAKFAKFDFERADHEFSVAGMIAETAKMRNGAVGTLDVKIHCIETSDDFAKCVWFWLEYTPAEWLSFAPDCRPSRTTHWASP